MINFKDDVIGVLKKKGYSKHCYPLEVFSESVDTNRKYADTKVFFNKWSGLFLLTAIPLISALLSVLVSNKGNPPFWLPESLAFPVSLALTFFTILNSIFKPSERFQEACRLGIAINNFMIGFLIELEKMEPVNDSELLELIDKKKKEFETYQIKMISMFMPADTSVQQSTVAETKKRHG
jgi:hypothetical protein